MCADGAHIAVDWEVPNSLRKKEITAEKIIRHPVVLILHGINNHSQFGYMKSLQRTFCHRGWNAVAVNFRGCGGVPLTTPRAYTAAYTGDLRSLVLQISSQLQKGVPLFLIGNSLGANLVTKYLGEEGLAGTLPEAVVGGISLGNPMLFRTNRVKFPHSVLMGLARKKGYWDQRHAVKEMNDPLFATAKRNATWSQTLGGLDQSLAPVMIRNNPYPPFEFRIGYEDADEYWTDSSSYEESQFISVPFMHVTARDDFLCHERFKSLLGYALSNPNIIVVETRTGGHLGWHEAHPESSSWWSVDSWANEATADFIQAIMVAHSERGSQCNDESRLNLLKHRMKEESRTASCQIKSNL
jgi:predicted alpha/beta-fold hydrolase